MFDAPDRSAPAAPAVAAPMIRLDRVSRLFPARGSAAPVAALQDVSLDVPRGSVMGVIGRSGAGKSTLVRLINGLERPSAGRVEVAGAILSDLPEPALRQARRGIGMVFQHFNLLSGRTAAGNVALPLELAGTPRAAIARRVAELLDLVGLADKAARYPAELSGGQKQRVGIARALATQPGVLLSDEATSALDPETTQSILALLRRINRDLGLTILLITHEMAVVRAVADRVAVLDAGRVVEQGPVFDLFLNPQAAVTRSFLAEETGRTLPCWVAARLRPIPDRSTLGQHRPDPSGQAVVRISFGGPHATDPIIAQLARQAGIDANILAGTVDEIAGHPFGTLVVGVPGGPPALARLRAFLAERRLGVEILGTLQEGPDHVA